MQGIDVKYIISILLGSHHSQQSGRSDDASLPISAVSIRLRKSVNFLCIFPFEVTTFYHQQSIINFLLEIYLTLEIRVSLNDNFVFLVDCMSNLVTSVSRQQAVDLKLHANETTKKMS